MPSQIYLLGKLRLPDLLSLIEYRLDFLGGWGSHHQQGDLIRIQVQLGRHSRSQLLALEKQSQEVHQLRPGKSSGNMAARSYLLCGRVSDVAGLSGLSHPAP